MKNMLSLSEISEIYQAVGGSLVERENFEKGVIFFSRTFIEENNFAVIPLWEGDIRTILFEGGANVKLADALQSQVEDSGENSLHIASIEHAEWPYAPNSSAITISFRRLLLSEENLSSIFEISANNVPYWGNTFIWPENRQFVLYTNGDSASFLAGNLDELEKIVGRKYSYCRNRFVEATEPHSNSFDVRPALIRFCDQFSLRA